MAKTKAKPKPKKGQEPAGLTPAQIEAILGVGLILAALGTLLSLFFTRGELTDAWINSLRRLLGWAFVVSPFWLGAAGFYLLFDSLDQRPDVRWDQVGGLVVVFLALLGLVHMGDGWLTQAAPDVLVDQGRGGGFIGRVISQGLSDALGGIGALMILAIFLVMGLTLAARGPLISLLRWIEATSTEVADNWRRGQVPINAAGGHSADNGLDEPGLTIRTGGRPAIEARTAPPSAPLSRPGIAPEPAQPLRRPTIIGSAEPAAPSTPLAAATQPELPLQEAPPAPKPVVARVLGANRDYRLPPISDILEDNIEQEVSRDEIRQKARIIEDTLGSFGVPARVVEVNQGPAITQFGVEPGYVEKRDSKGQVTRTKVKVNKISTLANDLALALAAPNIRIEAPVPGRPIVGIEVPNAKSHVVSLRGVLESDSFANIAGEDRLGFGLGQDVSGQPMAVDLTRMPHCLIAGATGSGKSACINAIIASLLLTHTPQTLRFLMVDPKRVELVGFNGIPHLLTDVIVEMEQVVGVMQLALREMDRRYRLFAKFGARNISGFNDIAESKGEAKLPFIVIIVDELADLMMVAADEVEKSVIRLGQMARATGIHLILATQRPSVDVVTGLIKANFPARVAFAVTSQVDSRVIIDTPGAEKLLGRGDMLYMAPDASKLQRLQGCYVTDKELDRLVRYWKGLGHRLSEPKAGLPQSLADEDQTAIPDENAWPPAPPTLTGRPPLTASGAPTTPPPRPTPPASNTPLASRRIEPNGTPPPSRAIPSTPRVMPPAIPGFGSVGSDDESGEARDDLWAAALEVVKGVKTASPSLLQRKLRIGYPRAQRLIEELEKAGILGPPEGPTRARQVLARPTDPEEDDEW
ncbi:MAG: DNA translocase FtsK 4TM domain-containing protein [Anaerolineae bacterium]|nr:DNA translocase FtsK 4TM domain-containing protein [Anaerolineae bacterium]